MAFVKGAQGKSKENSDTNRHLPMPKDVMIAIPCYTILIAFCMSILSGVVLAFDPAAPLVTFQPQQYIGQFSCCSGTGFAFAGGCRTATNSSEGCSSSIQLNVVESFPLCNNNGASAGHPAPCPSNGNDKPIGWGCTFHNPVQADMRTWVSCSNSGPWLVNANAAQCGAPSG